MLKFCFAGLLSVAFVLSACAAPPNGQVSSATKQPSSVSVAPKRAKNIILMVSDGTSPATWDMASYWEYGALGQQPYDQWPVKLGMTTYLAQRPTPPSTILPPQPSYSPASAWDTTPSNKIDSERRSYFEGYHYLKQNATDSAAGATTWAIGVKTYGGAISVDLQGRPLPTITEFAHSIGKVTGVVTTVPFSHATPAVFGSKNILRSNYAQIAAQMINGDMLDIVIGAGHPDFDENGLPRASKFQYIGEPEWTALKAGTAPRRLVQDTADFQAMARGERPAIGRFIGLPKAGTTLQFDRTLAVRGASTTNPSGTNFNPNLPDLTTLTKAALNELARDPDGFFLMVEGGAVDWAAHANNTGRAIEESIDFTNMVKATQAWLAEKGLDDETLIIIVTDHGNGMPMGPNSDTIPFQPIENRGKGVLPGMRWHHPSHSNENTRLWAIGPGSSALIDRVRLIDTQFAVRTGHNQDGATIDNTDVFRVMKAAFGDQ
jgi:alkaline phosphatase